MKEIKVLNLNGTVKRRLNIDEQKKQYSKLLDKNPTDQQVVDVLNYIHSYTVYKLSEKKKDE